MDLKNSANDEMESAGLEGSAAAPEAEPRIRPLTPTQNLANLFECPGCDDFCLPPLYQCSEGHMVCHLCRLKLRRCPICSGDIGKIRNLAMEHVANTVFFPCKYAANGCTKSLAHTRKIEHEHDDCNFRPYLCPLPGPVCKWHGLMSEAVPHLMSAHKNITTLQGEDIVFLATGIDTVGAVDWVMLQSCYGHTFMLVLEKQNKLFCPKYFAFVVIVGSRQNADRFSYRLELSNGHEDHRRRKLTWEAKPRSIQDENTSPVEVSDCLVFDQNVVDRFSEEGNLGICVAISLYIDAVD